MYIYEKDSNFQFVVRSPLPIEKDPVIPLTWTLSFVLQKLCMNLQGNLFLEYQGHAFNLKVKTFLKEGVYYFYISDNTKEERLLNGRTLELTYTDSFCATCEDPLPNERKIHPDIVNAVQDMLVKNKRLWFY